MLPIEIANGARTPLRPAAWRWIRANYLVDNHLYCTRKRDDEWTCSAAGFLRDLRACRDDLARQRLQRRMLDAWTAYSLYAGRGSTEDFLCWEIEARLLAGETVEQVAKRCGLPPGVIDYYHAWFFHVQDRLSTPAWVRSVIIGPKAHVGLTEADVDVILKLEGFLGGSSAVDVMLRYLRNPPCLEAPLELMNLAQLHDLRERLLIKAAILWHTHPADEKARRKIESCIRTIGKMERRAFGPGSIPVAEADWSLAGLPEASIPEFLHRLDQAMEINHRTESRAASVW